ncbi:MAG: alginate lyase family protein, partial [Desulfatiglandales bacterium]
MMRLKRASLPELLYRTKNRLENERLKRKVCKDCLSLPVPKINREDWSGLKMPEFKWDRSSSEPADLLKGKPYTLNEDESELKAFEAGWRDSFFGDIGFNGNDPDIRAVWEPARLQHLTGLLAAGVSSHADDALRMRQAVWSGVLDWIEKNPFLKGPHYLSPMECGLRIPVFVYALMANGHSMDEDRDRVLAAIYRHGWWVARRLSLYASLGNHTVCECVGLIFAGAVFRETPEGKAWLERGRMLLDRELYHQILEDGGPSEQSVSYHRFVLDLYWLAVDFLEKNRLAECSGWKTRLKRGETFLSHFQTEGKMPLSIGDSDDGWAVAPGVYPCRYEPENRHNINGVMTFEQSGVSLIRGDEGIVMTFDHGPLGMPPLYNHGHADALSITLQYEGKEFLVDPGTFRYNGEPLFRHYFKGTRAHNTVTLDDQDQAVQETGFIWSSPFNSVLVENRDTPQGYFLKARHNGYERLPGKVIHSRAVLFFNGRHFLIKDGFSGLREHKFEINFHIHPDAKIDEEGGWWEIARGQSAVYLRLIDGGQFGTSCGEESPVHGWYSPCYGVKKKCTVLHATTRGKA